MAAAAQVDDGYSNQRHATRRSLAGSLLPIELRCDLCPASGAESFLTQLQDVSVLVSMFQDRWQPLTWLLSRQRGSCVCLTLQTWTLTQSSAVSLACPGGEFTAGVSRIEFHWCCRLPTNRFHFFVRRDEAVITSRMCCW